MAADRFNIATKSVNERIGVQEDTNKNASDCERRKMRMRRMRRRGRRAAAASERGTGVLFV